MADLDSTDYGQIGVCSALFGFSLLTTASVVAVMTGGGTSRTGESSTLSPAEAEALREAAHSLDPSEMARVSPVDLIELTAQPLLALLSSPSGLLGFFGVSFIGAGVLFIEVATEKARGEDGGEVSDCA